MQDSLLKMKTSSLLSFDRNHIWHPYTSATSPNGCLLVEKAEGVHLQLHDGTKVIDGMSSWWSVIHGYNHPELNQALIDQTHKMAHVMFGGLTHRPAIELAYALLKIVPDGLEHVFYCDSGSVAVEVAMKMALQYWHSKKMANKNQFVTIKKGYHGDTWHAMSVCDPVTGMHHIFNDRLSAQYFLPPPRSAFGGTFDESESEAIEKFLAKYCNNIAAFILEPIVQGAGGMRFYHPGYLTQVKQLCKKYSVLLIADEIATGFGRTGKMFACEHSGISPDIMCIGKALTGGYMSFAATLCTGDIARIISGGNPGVFMHGPTFIGNPLACAVALESLILLQKNKYNINRIEQLLKQGLYPLKNNKAVADIRVLGAIGVVEMKKNVVMDTVQKAFIEQGIWLRPFGKLIYTMPPFIISDNDLQSLTKSLRNVITELNN
jgi:adenosylmethionine---8-amino-7-oxononanoate aminotransferase